MYPSTDLTMYIYVDPRYETLRAFYRNRIQEHNNAIYNSPYPDSGFDLGLPKNFQITKKISNKIKECKSLQLSRSYTISTKIYAGK